MLKREEKEKIVKNLAKKLKKLSFAFMDFASVSSAQMAELKSKAKEEESEAKVVKRNLLIKALQKAGLSEDLPQGSYLLVSNEKDEIAPFKFVAQFIKENEAGSFQGGVFEKQLISPQEAEKIATLPSKDELKAKLVFVLASPIRQLHYNLSYNLTGLINILKQKAESNA